MNNPFLEENNQPYNSVPFNQINSNHFLPAINHYIIETEKILKIFVIIQILQTLKIQF